MPLYEVHHSYPLEPAEKQNLAQAITKLHATTFVTPSAFVQVRYISHNATDQSLYIAGHPHTTSSNRILAFVRHNSTRAKSTYDTLASHLDSAWRDAIYGEVITEGKDKGKRPKEVDEIERDMLARKLLAVAFVPIVAVRELGTAMPEAGAEAAWFAENLEFFRKQSEEKGDEIVTAMLEEVSTREDLKAYREGEGVSGLLNKLKLTASGQGEKK